MKSLESVIIAKRNSIIKERIIEIVENGKCFINVEKRRSVSNITPINVLVIENVKDKLECIKVDLSLTSHFHCEYYLTSKLCDVSLSDEEYFTFVQLGEILTRKK